MLVLLGFIIILIIIIIIIIIIFNFCQSSVASAGNFALMLSLQTHLSFSFLPVFCLFLLLPLFLVTISRDK